MVSREVVPILMVNIVLQKYVSVCTVKMGIGLDESGYQVKSFLIS